MILERVIIGVLSSVITDVSGAEWHWGVRDAKKHHYLRYYSGLPWNPSYTKGTPLTVGVLNSGKVGTTPNI